MINNIRSGGTTNIGGGGSEKWRNKIPFIVIFLICLPFYNHTNDIQSYFYLSFLTPKSVQYSFGRGGAAWTS